MYFTVQLEDTGLVDFILNDTSDPNAGLVLTSTQTLPINQWNHVVCSFGPSGRKIYINDVLASPSDTTAIILPSYQGESILGWNSLSEPPMPSEHYWGVFDEAVLYNQVLSSDVILGLSTAH